MPGFPRPAGSNLLPSTNHIATRSSSKVYAAIKETKFLRDFISRRRWGSFGGSRAGLKPAQDQELLILRLEADRSSRCPSVQQLTPMTHIYLKRPSKVATRFWVMATLIGPTRASRSATSLLMPGESTLLRKVSRRQMRRAGACNVHTFFVTG